MGRCNAGGDRRLRFLLASLFEYVLWPMTRLLSLATVAIFAASGTALAQKCDRFLVAEDIEGFKACVGGYGSAGNPSTPPQQRKSSVAPVTANIPYKGAIDNAEKYEALLRRERRDRVKAKACEFFRGRSKSDLGDESVCRNLSSRHREACLEAEPDAPSTCAAESSNRGAACFRLITVCRTGNLSK